MTFGSYNIAAGRDVDTDMSVLAKDITDSGLDVVGLQEVVTKTPGVAYRDLLKDLAEKAGFPYFKFFRALNMSALAEDGGYGLAIMSKYPIKDTELILLDSSLDGKNYEQRVMGRATIDVNGTEINFFVTHLSFEATQVRKNQFTQISEIFKSYDNFVLVGDFNTQIFPEYKLLEGCVNLIRSRKYITYPSTRESIDNIIYSEGDWTFSDPTAVETGHSDHNMIFATGTLVQKPAEKTE